MIIFLFVVPSQYFSNCPPPRQLSKRHEYMVSRLFIWKRCLKVTILLWTNLGWYPPDCIDLKNVCGGTKVPVIIFKNEIDIFSYFWKKYIILSKSRYIFKIFSIFEVFSKKSRVIDLIFEKNNWISIFPKNYSPKSRSKMVFRHFLQKNAPLLSTFWVPRGTGREEWRNDVHSEEKSFFYYDTYARGK